MYTVIRKIFIRVGKFPQEIFYTMLVKFRACAGAIRKFPPENFCTVTKTVKVENARRCSK